MAKESAKFSQAAMSGEGVSGLNLRVAWESFPELGAAMPKQEVVNKSPSLNTEGVADTGCTVFCGGLDTMRKMKIPQGALITSDITLYSADRRPLTT